MAGMSHRQEQQQPIPLFSFSGSGTNNTLSRGNINSNTTNATGRQNLNSNTTITTTMAAAVPFKTTSTAHGVDSIPNEAVASSSQVAAAKQQWQHKVDELEADFKKYAYKMLQITNPKALERVCGAYALTQKTLKREYRNQVGLNSNINSMPVVPQRASLSFDTSPGIPLAAATNAGASSSSSPTTNFATTSIASSGPAFTTEEALTTDDGDGAAEKQTAFAPSIDPNWADVFTIEKVSVFVHVEPSNPQSKVVRKGAGTLRLQQSTTLTTTAGDSKHRLVLKFGNTIVLNMMVEIKPSMVEVRSNRKLSSAATVHAKLILKGLQDENRGLETVYLRMMLDDGKILYDKLLALTQ